jgi:hypothetical protein
MQLGTCNLGLAIWKWWNEIRDLVFYIRNYVTFGNAELGTGKYFRRRRNSEFKV